METSFDSVGIPAGHVALVYHEPTSSVIAHVAPHPELPPRKRLFFRWASDTRYQPVAAFPDNISIDSFVVDPSRPSLYFITNEWKSIPGRKAAAGNWDALYRFDLEEHRCERLTCRGALRPPNEYEETWLSAVLSTAVDGQGLFCNVALTKQGCVDHWICKLDLARMQSNPITRLAAAFA